MEAPAAVRSIRLYYDQLLIAWVTVHSGDIGNTFGPNGFAIGSSGTSHLSFQFVRAAGSLTSVAGVRALQILPVTSPRLKTSWSLATAKPNTARRTFIIDTRSRWKWATAKGAPRPDSPAFTFLEKRQTFLEEALFRPRAVRSRSLLERYRVPLDQLLDFAVTHELAHAMCQEVDEPKVAAYAGQLRRAGTVVCGESGSRIP